MGYRSEEFKYKIKIKIRMMGNKINLNRIPNAVARLNMSKAQHGRKHSEETKIKMSLWQIGKNVSYETRLKMSLSRLGKKFSPLSEETKEKISIALRGRKVSNNTRKKMSDAKYVTHCKRGHEFTEESIEYSVRKNGNIKRRCKICKTNRIKKMKYALIIDDLRLFGDTFNGMPIIYAINSKQALDQLNKNYNDFAEILLDHDLGLVDGNPDDIGPVLNWLEEKAFYGELQDVKLRILTANPVGFQRIKALEKYFEILPTVKHVSIRE